MFPRELGFLTRCVVQSAPPGQTRGVSCSDCACACCATCAFRRFCLSDSLETFFFYLTKCLLLVNCVSEVYLFVVVFSSAIVAGSEGNSSSTLARLQSPLVAKALSLTRASTVPHSTRIFPVRPDPPCQLRGILHFPQRKLKPPPKNTLVIQSQSDRTAIQTNPAGCAGQLESMRV